MSLDTLPSDSIKFKINAFYFITFSVKYILLISNFRYLTQFQCSIDKQLNDTLCHFTTCKVKNVTDWPNVFINTIIFFYIFTDITNLAKQLMLSEIKIDEIELMKHNNIFLRYFT